MRIDGPTTYLYTGQRTQPATSGAATTTSFAEALSTTQAGGVKQTDFTNMTREDMRDWVNSQIRSGQMSLDDSRPFMAMTMKIPAGGAAGEIPAASDNTRYDFTQKVRDGIDGALSRNDDTTLKMLASAMSIMQKEQGQAFGLDVRA